MCSTEPFGRNASTAPVLRFVNDSVRVTFTINTRAASSQWEAPAASRRISVPPCQVDGAQVIASAESASAAAFDPYPRALCRAQLPRYLNCCSELLALTSKLAALHAQYLHD
jgi:hypothetical protein